MDRTEAAGWNDRFTLESGAPGFPPGEYVASLLDQLVEPAEVIFSDWYCAEGFGFDSTSGAAFALVPGNAVNILWTDIPSDMHYSMEQARPPAVEVVFHPLHKPPSIRLRVENVYHLVKSTPSKAVTLEGEGWSQELPFNRRYRQNFADYCREIRAAVRRASP